MSRNFGSRSGFRVICRLSVRDGLGIWIGIGLEQGFGGSPDLQCLEIQLFSCDGVYTISKCHRL